MVHIEPMKSLGHELFSFAEMLILLQYTKQVVLCPHNVWNNNASQGSISELKCCSLLH